MNVSDVYVFKKVAATLSFTKAARQIGLSRSAVSKQVSRLEQDLGVVLLNRNTRSVNLTEAGRTFNTYTSDIDTTIERAAELVRGADMSPTGTVKFALPSGLGASLMPELATTFRAKWPELHLGVYFQDRIDDLIGSDLDLAITVSRKLGDSSFISRRLVSTRKVLAASPEYLCEMGSPRTVDDLDKHRCLGITTKSNPDATWRLSRKNGQSEFRKPMAMSTNNDLALILAACLGCGIICVPEVYILGELARQQLIPVLPESTEPTVYGVFAIYPNRHAATKVKVLVEFIEDQLRRLPEIDRWTPLFNAAARQ